MQLMIVAGALALAGCTGSAEAVGDCPVVDLCARVPLSTVKAVCGTSATGSSSSQEPTSDPVGISCAYAVSDFNEFKVTRQCFIRGAATAARNDLEWLRQTAKQPGVDQEDLTGLGQSALFLYGGLAPIQAELYVQQGNVLFDLHDDEPGDDVGASRACLTTLAQSLLEP